MNFTHDYAEITHNTTWQWLYSVENFERIGASKLSFTVYVSEPDFGEKTDLSEERLFAALLFKNYSNNPANSTTTSDSDDSDSTI
jgi:hypothetical protein